MLSTLSVFILLISLLFVLTDKLSHGIRLLGLQSFLLAGVAIEIGYLENQSHLYGAAILIVGIKAIGIPNVMMWYMRRAQLPNKVEPFLSREWSLVCGLGLMMIGYSVIPTDFIYTPRESTQLMAVAISIGLIGCLQMLTRPSGLFQLLGFLSLENGVSLAGMLLTHGIPATVETGIYVEVLVGIWLIILFSRKSPERRKGVDHVD